VAAGGTASTDRRAGRVLPEVGATAAATVLPNATDAMLKAIFFASDRELGMK